MVINTHLVPAGYADGEGPRVEAEYEMYDQASLYYGFGDGPEGDGEGDNSE